MMGTAGELPKAPEKKILFAEDMTEATLNKAVSDLSSNICVPLPVFHSS